MSDSSKKSLVISDGIISEYDIIHQCKELEKKISNIDKFTSKINECKVKFIEKKSIDPSINAYTLITTFLEINKLSEINKIQQHIISELLKYNHIINDL